MNTLYPLKTINQLRPLLIGFRKVNGLTQKDVAERLGVTQQTYARLEASPGSATMTVCHGTRRGAYLFNC